MGNTWRCIERADRLANTLTILQWNTNGIKTKIGDLSKKAKDHNADILIFQESKLRETDPDLDIRINGYNEDPVRADRQGGRTGGGLITYIRDGITFRKKIVNPVGGIEAQTISVKQVGNDCSREGIWLNITNVYIPPSKKDARAKFTRLDLECLPIDDRAVVAGDFNAYHQRWDKGEADHGEKKRRGEEIIAWTEKNVREEGEEPRLHICNDGTPTRRGNALDLTIVTNNLKDDVEWKVDEDFEISDHYPIIIKVKPPP